MRSTAINSARDLFSRTVGTDDIPRRIIFLSLSIARAASIFLFRPVPSPDVRANRGNAISSGRFCQYVRLMVSAIRSKARPRGSSYLCCSCNDSFYSRMHAACDRERERAHALPS